MVPQFIDKSQLSKKSGVYIFKDIDKKILYVGKAINLYHRVSSYFLRPRDHKTSVLVDKIASVETIVVESELEALILEANLIKKYLPAFNVRLTDDKDYLYIAVTQEDFPKIITSRKKDLKNMKKFWGPFPSSRTVRDTIRLLRRVFPWCNNPPMFTLQPSRLKARYRACFYYHIGLCPGACVGLISKQDYQKIINRFCKFLEGKKQEVVDNLMDEMRKASKDQRFEEAARLKKMIDGISYLTQPNRAALYLENPSFLEEENKLALIDLQRDLNLEKLPERIEAYDISNIQGKDATGSMVVLTNGEVDKSQYRKFKIHISGKPNDVAMMKEMIRRRLKHPEWPAPDLIIVDGGRGQVNAVKYEIRTTDYEIPFFGLAKRMEWLYSEEGDVVKLPRKSLSLRLLQKIRDEAHRFALIYHRKLHLKSILP